MLVAKSCQRRHRHLSLKTKNNGKARPQEQACTGRESNPGLSRGRREIYHWTTRATKNLKIFYVFVRRIGARQSTAVSFTWFNYLKQVASDSKKKVVPIRKNKQTNKQTNLPYFIHSFCCCCCCCCFAEELYYFMTLEELLMKGIHFGVTCIQRQPRSLMFDKKNYLWHFFITLMKVHL